MKILRLLNNNYFSIIFVIFFINNTAIKAEIQPVDIWKLDQNENEVIKSDNNQDDLDDVNFEAPEPSIYDLQSQKETDLVQVDSSIGSQQVKILGLYDPEDYDLKMDMWSNSNGDQLKSLFSNVNKLNLSRDASELMNIVMLTNSYYPEQNIKDDEFLKMKSDWLIKNNDRDLIEKYLINNQILNVHPKLSRYLVDQHLAESNIEKACKLFLRNTQVIQNDYLSKFNLYCLINDGRNEEAQLILDLKKELGFTDEYFEKKINFLLGYPEKLDLTISENSILDFHLAHRTNPNFILLS